ncbi:TonB-dependent receptor plug domain-containing protein [Campylobacter troglodytis]|uniref:TonB-dependent receptor plug domain-containing protein n=1 Tax=Campylobacter troglodytis TaxID=654363 RepID=UPI00249EF6D8|nr:TonB-dependent receptor plug domain-containing protein [Campylobacter troglodytis]
MEANLYENKHYQAGLSLNEQVLKTSPSGNGDLGSMLRILPNVQFDNSQLKSSTPGEIDPARISISGGLHYQNNFMLDGVNMNNDLDPAGSGSWTTKAPGRSQGLAIDTSLLESIKVQDSNIGAAYGGFMGGVVEATTKRPSKPFSADLSYQITNGKADGGLDLRHFKMGKISLTKYHLYENQDLDEFLNSYDDDNQPNFTKHLMRASIESKINDKFSLIGSFSSTKSIIPLRSSDDSYKSSSGNSQSSPVDPADSSYAKQDQKREIYNYFIKGYWDFSENLRLDLSYLYAPQNDFRFIVGTRGDYYNFKSGGHQASSKLEWYNAWGYLSNVISYSLLENSAQTNFDATKYWQISDSKRWSNWATWVRSGGWAPSRSLQETITNTISQEFIPFNLGPSTHTISTGLELSYQRSSFKYSKPYDSAVKTSTFMTQAKQALCQTTDMSWCDTARAYDPRGFEAFAYSQDQSPFEIETMDDGRKYLVWKYGQYFNSLSRFDSSKKIKVSSKSLAYFLQDDVEFKLSDFGKLNLRPGVRFDYEGLMSKLTVAPRFALTYVAPWQNGFDSTVTLGANRYYGRNITALILNDGIESLERTLYRDSPNKSWDEINQECPAYARRERKSTSYTNALTGRNATNNEWVYYDANGNKISRTNCYESYKNSTKFEKLKVPFVDEFMAGLEQNILGLKVGAKYIYRQSKDDLRRIRSDYRNLEADSNYASTYYTYTNEGKSTSKIITLSAENTEPLSLFSTHHFFLFALDFTQTKRNYLSYNEIASREEDELIVYDGKLIYSSQRPVSNFAKPYTARLSTMHSFEFGKNLISLNNFFRFRSSYDAIALISNANSNPSTRSLAYSQYRPEFRAYKQYGKYKIPSAFTYDLRLGYARKIYGQHSIYFNIDIFNVLDSKNTTINQADYAGSSYAPSLGYEVGRQFWLQVGYKY